MSLTMDRDEKTVLFDFLHEDAGSPVPATSVGYRRNLQQIIAEDGVSQEEALEILEAEDDQFNAHMLELERKGVAQRKEREAIKDRLNQSIKRMRFAQAGFAIVAVLCFLIYFIVGGLG